MLAAIYQSRMSDGAPHTCCEVVSDIVIMPTVIGFGHQHLDIVSDDIGLGVAEQPFCCRTERTDRTRLGDNDHCVRHGVEDRSEMTFTTFERGFSRLLIGDILNDFSKAAQRSAGVIQRGHRYAGQEFRAVLAQAPAILFKTTQPMRAGKIILRLTSGNLLGGIENREIASDHFFRRPALDSLRAAIPDCDAALGIEHINSVVGRAIDQEG